MTSINDEWKVIMSVFGNAVVTIEKITPNQLIGFIPKFVLVVEKFDKLTGPQKQALVLSSLDTLAKKYITNADELAEVDTLISKYVPEIINGIVSVANSKEFKIFRGTFKGCGR